jgi:hypothetical protein
VRLVLGVVDVAYSGDNGAVTTGQVAEWIEGSYGVMSIFWEEYQDKAVRALVAAAKDSIQDVISGAPRPSNPFLGAEQKIESLFRDFLSRGEIEKISPDVPTQAALDRKSKRFKSGKAPDQRPSFIDTGLYQASFRAWIEDD